MSAPQRSPSGRARNWSWNRLADDAARSIVDASFVPSDALVLDLGAGDGAITRHLVSTGARVVAFELHPERAATLRRRFAHADVRIVVADVRDLRLPRRPFRVVANPPFRGVNAVLVRLTHRSSRLERADLVVPRSVAVAWTARLRTSRFAVVDIRPLSRSSFHPRPRIDIVHATVLPNDRAGQMTVRR